MVTHEQKLEKTYGLGALHVIVDTVTGVNYINTVGEGYSGLTPLLDGRGNVVVTPEYIGCGEEDNISD
ncbi:MAG: xylan 1,4-beta-xylosidase [Ruminococcus sp.]|nr:xylan 1,4-beta-xylosidase [Ruminococcus sp.]